MRLTVNVKWIEGEVYYGVIEMCWFSEHINLILNKRTYNGT